MWETWGPGTWVVLTAGCRYSGRCEPRGLGAALWKPLRSAHTYILLGAARVHFDSQNRLAKMGFVSFALTGWKKLYLRENSF